VRADRDRIVQVLTNLLSNALKFSPKGSSVDLAVEAKGEVVRFGYGTAAPAFRGVPRQAVHALSHSPIARGASRRGPASASAICRALVVSSRRRNRVESEPGRGASFFFHPPGGGRQGLGSGMAFEEKRDLVETRATRIARCSSIISLVPRTGSHSCRPPSPPPSREARARKDQLRTALHSSRDRPVRTASPELGELARDLEKRVVSADDLLRKTSSSTPSPCGTRWSRRSRSARSRIVPREVVPHLSPIRQKLVVAVIGGGLEDPRTDDTAKAVGAALARAGAHLVCGGLGGCMEGAARGYREAKGEGIVVGILPGPSRHEANPWIDLPIPTGVGPGTGGARGHGGGRRHRGRRGAAER